MRSIRLYLEKKAYKEFNTDGCISLDTYTTLIECGYDPDELEDEFMTGRYTPSTTNTPILIGCTQEDVEDIIDAAIGNNIERLIDIKDACDNILKG